MKRPLKFVGPNGSLKKRWQMYLRTVGYDLPDEPDSRGCYGVSNGIEFWERDRRMVPFHIVRMFDAGLTGKDLVVNSKMEEELRLVSTLNFSRNTDQPTCWVFATKEGVDVHSLAKEGKLRIGCELPRFAAKLIPNRCSLWVDRYQIVQLEGDEEQAIDDGLCDLILCVTETGKSLDRAGLSILDGCETLFVSTPVIAAKPHLEDGKEELLYSLSLSLQAAIGASSRVMVKFDIHEKSLDNLNLPAAVAPTVNEVRRHGWVAVEICVNRSDVPVILPLIEKVGGAAIVMQNVEAYLHGRSTDEADRRSKDHASPVPETDIIGYRH